MWQPVAAVAEKLRVDQAEVWRLIREAKVAHHRGKLGLICVRERNVRRALVQDAENRLRGVTLQEWSWSDTGWLDRVPPAGSESS